MWFLCQQNKNKKRTRTRPVLHGPVLQFATHPAKFGDQLSSLVFERAVGNHSSAPTLLMGFHSEW
jgi:hypothetical protein